MIEVAIGLTLLMVLATGAYTAMTETGESLGSLAQRTRVQSEIRASLQQVSEDLMDAGNITVDEFDLEGQVVTFQVPVKVKDNKVTWGANVFDAKEGKTKTKKGHWNQYLMVTRTLNNGTRVQDLVLRTLDKKREKIKGDDRVIAKNVRGTRNNHKGFKVNRNGDLFTIEISVVETRGNSEKVNHAFRLKTTVLAPNWKYESDQEDDKDDEDDEDDKDDKDDKDK